jgi:hypothetical protein
VISKHPAKASSKRLGASALYCKEPLRWYESCPLANVQLQILAALLALSACGATHAAPDAAGGAAGSSGSGNLSGEVELGVPGGPDGLDFAPMQDGDVLRLETFGQGGVHVLLAVRCIGFGSRAFVSITLTNSNTGTEVVAPPPVRPQLLFCDGDTCDLVPITVIATGLTPLGAERDGLPIEILADVHNVAGVTGQASKSAVLSTADL